MDGNFSLSDFATLANANNGGVGGNSLWFILLFFLIFGNGNGWNRGAGDYGTYATSASQQDILFSSKFQNIDNKIDKLGNGIADATYATSQLINNAQSALNNAIVTGATNTASAVVAEGRATQDAICGMRYDMANMSASINANIDAKFAALEKSQLEQQIAAQAQQINQLQINQAVCGIPKVSTYAWGTYPYTAPACGGCNCGNL